MKKLLKLTLLLSIATMPVSIFSVKIGMVRRGESEQVATRHGEEVVYDSDEEKDDISDDESDPETEEVSAPSPAPAPRRASVPNPASVPRRAPAPSPAPAPRRAAESTERTVTQRLEALEEKIRRMEEEGLAQRMRALPGALGTWIVEHKLVAGGAAVAAFAAITYYVWSKRTNNKQQDGRCLDCNNDGWEDFSSF